METSQHSEPDVVDAQYGGKWVAWDNENLHIVASGATAEEAQQNALATGVSDPILEFIPPSDAVFAGGL
jgi:hypothetical protein